MDKNSFSRQGSAAVVAKTRKRGWDQERALKRYLGFSWRKAAAKRRRPTVVRSARPAQAAEAILRAAATQRQGQRENWNLHSRRHADRPDFLAKDSLSKKGKNEIRREKCTKHRKKVRRTERSAAIISGHAAAGAQTAAEARAVGATANELSFSSGPLTLFCRANYRRSCFGSQLTDWLAHAAVFTRPS